MVAEQSKNAAEQGGKSTALMTDIENIAADANQLLKEVVDSSAEEFVAMQAKVEAKLNKAKSRLVKARKAAMVTVRSATDASCRYARHNPWKLLWMSAAVITVIGISVMCQRDR